MIFLRFIDLKFVEFLIKSELSACKKKRSVKERTKKFLNFRQWFISFNWVCKYFFRGFNNIFCCYFFCEEEKKRKKTQKKYFEEFVNIYFFEYKTGKIVCIHFFSCYFYFVMSPNIVIKVQFLMLVHTQIEIQTTRKIRGDLDCTSCVYCSSWFLL